MYYIGRHSTNNLNDGYMGSGVLLQKAITKYGIDNFSLEILEFHKDFETLCKREREIVNHDFIELKSNYNLALGGKGTLTLNSESKRKYLNTMNSDSYKKKMSKIQKEAQNRPEVRIKRKRQMLITRSSESYRKRMSKIQKEVQNRPEVREIRVNALKLKWSDPNFRSTRENQLFIYKSDTKIYNVFKRPLRIDMKRYNIQIREIKVIIENLDISYEQMRFKFMSLFNKFLPKSIYKYVTLMNNLDRAIKLIHEIKEFEC